MFHSAGFSCLYPVDLPKNRERPSLTRIFRDGATVVHFRAMSQHSTSAKLPRDIATKILDRAASLDATDERIDGCQSPSD